MDPADAPASLIGPAVIAAVISGLIAIIGFAITTWNARRLHREKLDFDRDLAERKASADVALAEKKLALDRAFAAWKRRTEFAEEVLGDFYQARDIIQSARSPGGFGDEGNTRVKEGWETEGDTRLLNSYFRTLERLDKKTEFFAQLLARRYRFIAIFGPEAAKPYDDFWRLRGEIIVAIQMLLQTHRQRDLGSLPQDRKTWETTMGWVHTAQDPIEVRLNQIIEEIEKTCRPAIQEVVQ
jgi:hypothetical protein